MAHFHQRRRRRIPKRIPNLIDTLYYAQLFPLVWRWRQRRRRRLFPVVTVPILGTDLRPIPYIVNQGIGICLRTSGKTGIVPESVWESVSVSVGGNKH